MDRTVLNKYKNPEEKLILSKIIDKIDFCEKRNQIQITDFLDLAKQELAKKFLQVQRVDNYILFGGYEQAERKILMIYPNKIKDLIRENKINFEEWIKVISITLPNENKGQYVHQNYLRRTYKTRIKKRENRRYTS